LKAGEKGWRRTVKKKASNGDTDGGKFESKNGKVYAEKVNEGIMHSKSPRERTKNARERKLKNLSR